MFNWVEKIHLKKTGTGSWLSQQPHKGHYKRNFLRLCSKPVVSLSLPNNIGTPEWKPYLRLDANETVLLKRCQTRLHNWEILANESKICQLIWETMTPPTTTSSSWRIDAMNILWPHWKMGNGRQFVQVMKNRYKKVRKALLVSKRCGSHIASQVSYLKIVACWVHGHVRNDKGTRFISKLFESLWSFFGTTHLKHTTYDRQTNR